MASRATGANMSREEYVANMRQNLEQFSREGKPKPIKYKAADDFQLHRLPKDVTTNPEAVVSIKVNNCGVIYIGSREKDKGDPNLDVRLVMWPYRNLTTLRVVDCKLQVLPSGLGSITGLKTINVAGNFLHVLPGDVFGGPQLKEFSASNNLLNGDLPRGLLDSRSLQTLCLDNNDLEAKHFPQADDGVEALALQLKNLTLDESTVVSGRSPLPLKGKLHVLPASEHTSTFARQQRDSRFALVSGSHSPPPLVRFASAASCFSLVSGPQGSSYELKYYEPTGVEVTELEHLRELYEASLVNGKLVRSGPISKVTQILIKGEADVANHLDMIRAASNARVVSIVDCGLEDLGNDFFKGLSSLETVVCSGNALKRLPNSFQFAETVRVAIFDNNLIEEFPFIPPNLTTLSMNGNCLCVTNKPMQSTNVISPKNFTGSRALVDLDLGNNPMLVSEFFPSNGRVPHLTLERLVLDRRAVANTAKERLPFRFAKDVFVGFVEEPSETWLAKMQASGTLSKYSAQGAIGKTRFA